MYLVWFLGDFQTTIKCCWSADVRIYKDERKAGLPSLLSRAVSLLRFSNYSRNIRAGGDEAQSRTYIDNGICLNVVHIGVAEPQLLPSTLSSTDDPCRHCVLQGKRTSNRHYKFSWPQVCRLAEQKNWQFTLQTNIKLKYE